MNSASDRSVRVRRGSAAAVVCCAGLAFPAFGQLSTSVTANLRPFMYFSPVGGGTNGQGIFDTGAPSLVVAPETNVRFGIAQSAGDTNTFYARQFGFAPGMMVGPMGNQVARSAGVVGNYTNFALGGLYGGRFDGPSLGTNGVAGAAPPAHAFASAGNLIRTDGVTRNGISPALEYFNGSFSDNILGMSVVASGGRAGNSAAGVLVDPYNAGPSAFPFSIPDPNVGSPFNDLNTNGMRDAGEPFYDPVNGAFGPGGGAVFRANNALGTDNGPIDNRTSSVSFFNPAAQVTPNTTANFNPGFMAYVPLEARLNRLGGRAAANNPIAPAGFVNTDFATAGGAAQDATVAPRPFATLPANNPLGVAAGTYLMDTGAVATGAAGGATFGIIGTTALNRFGQFWDFSNNNQNPVQYVTDPATGFTRPVDNRGTLMLFGATRLGDRHLIGDGMLFTVGNGSTGLARTAVDQLATYGGPADTRPGMAADVSGSRNTFGQEGVGIFKTQMSQSNGAYAGGVDALGLRGGGQDQVDGLSIGADPIRRGVSILFSVSEDSQGRAGGDSGDAGGVRAQRALGQHAGDVFQSATAQKARVNGTNTVRFNQDSMGLAGNAGPYASAAGRGHRDNLRDFDLETWRAMPNNSMRNMDPMVRSAGDTRAYGNVGARPDVLGRDYAMYFTLTQESATVNDPNESRQGGDIYRSRANGSGFEVFASAGLIGVLGDDIDAMALYRPAGTGVNANVIRGVRPAFYDEGYVPEFFARSLPQETALDRGNMTTDFMLFSLAPGSTSLNLTDAFLGGRRLSAADIFVTDFSGMFWLFASAESLGLDPMTDNIDGLDVTTIPTPTGVGVLVVGALAAGRRRRR